MVHRYASLLFAAALCSPTILSAQCDAGEVQVTIEVTTDDYGYETYWQLVPGGNACGTGTLFEGGNLTMDCNSGGGQVQDLTGYGNATTITEGPWCLTEGATYTIHSIDDWGDSQASFEVFVSGGSVATFQTPGAANAFTFTAQPPVARDLAVTDLITSLFAVEGEAIPVRGTIRSLGLDVVSSFHLNYSIDNGTPVTQDITGLSLASGESYDFTHSVPWTPPATGTYELRVWADAINGGADQNPVNDERGSHHVIRAPIPDRIDDLLASAEPVVTVEANSDQDLAVPRDLAFHPDPSRDELWVINKDTEESGSSTVKFTHPGTAQQTFLMQEDPNNWHFMSLATGIAFGDNGNFATSPGVFDANHNGTPPFTGITLWSSDPAIYAQNLFGPLGSHLDMLHVTPNAQGIAAESWNVYWAVDGYNHDVVRHDFKADHGPGHDYHGNAVIRRYSGMSITKDPNDHIVGHCVLDKALHWLYVVDHGGRRVVRLNTLSGTPGGAPAFGPFESYVEYTQMVNDEWEEVATTGLVEPAGIALIGDHLLVSDHSNGEIVVYDIGTSGTPEIGRVATNSPGLMGIEIGPDGSIWGVNATYHQLLRIGPSPSVGVKELPMARFQVFPVPASDRLRFAGLQPQAGERLQVLDATGRLVMEAPALSAAANGLDISGLADGQYMVRSNTQPSRTARFSVAR